MYAKVFSQIFDSSIADDFRLRHFFMDLLVLADVNGVVDMTPAAIAGRTRIPLDDVTPMLAKLEQPDPESRTPDADGRRLERLDDHRSWGWHIINYSRFRSIASEEQRRETTRLRVARFKAKRQQNATGNAVVTHGNAQVTPGNAGNAMQKQRQKQRQKKTKTTAPQAARSPSSKIFPADLEEVYAFAAEIGCPENVTLRWLRWNQVHGWPIESWKGALRGFWDHCERCPEGWGVDSVPDNWEPSIPASEPDIELPGNDSVPQETTT